MKRRPREELEGREGPIKLTTVVQLRMPCEQAEVVVAEVALPSAAVGTMAVVLPSAVVVVVISAVEAAAATAPGMELMGASGISVYVVVFSLALMAMSHALARRRSQEKGAGMRL